MPSLRQLEAKLIRRKVENGHVYDCFVEQIAEADGLFFLCPKCFGQNGGSVGTHAVICWFIGKVPDDAVPKPGRWNPSGKGIDDLTFVDHGAASVLLLGGCGWHGFVKNGLAD